MNEPHPPGSEPTTDEPEVSRFSLWFLRGALVVATLVVFGFLAQAVVSLLDDDDDGDETVADLLATTTTTEAAVATDAGGDDEADGDADASTTTTAAPESTTTTEALDEQAELDAFVDEAITFIEDIREREFLERPLVELVDVDTMTQIVLDDIEADLAGDPEGSAESLAFARAIGFFEPDADFLDVYEVFVSGGVLGVYFPTSDRLLVRSDGELTLSAKATVVHELVHAFDDQHFDLDRVELGSDSDASWAFIAAVEGSASYVEDLWRDSLSAEEQRALDREEASFEAGDIFSLDFGFLIYQTSVYEYGQTWLERRIETEGVAAIDDAVINGAPSSEVVIEPLDSPALDIVSVAAPEVDGDVIWQGDGGQALIDALLFTTDFTREAARGWGGDAITVYADAADRACLRWDIAMDSAADRDELVTALDPWAREVGADVNLVGDLVRVDRCAG
ncbi:MAG: hypothetical protein AAGE98_12380 [Actinomycetota bacterium]